MVTTLVVVYVVGMVAHIMGPLMWERYRRGLRYPGKANFWEQWAYNWSEVHPAPAILCLLWPIVDLVYGCIVVGRLLCTKPLRWAERLGERHRKRDEAIRAALAEHQKKSRQP